MKNLFTTGMIFEPHLSICCPLPCKRTFRPGCVLIEICVCRFLHLCLVTSLYVPWISFNILFNYAPHDSLVSSPCCIKVVVLISVPSPCCIITLSMKSFTFAQVCCREKNFRSYISAFGKVPCHSVFPPIKQGTCLRLQRILQTQRHFLCYEVPVEPLEMYRVGSLCHL